MPNHQYDIFISYSDKDRELARKVYEALKAEGLNCWIAFQDIPHGEVWAKAITQGIKNSKAVLLILTTNSNNSDQVLREIEYADKQKKKLYCYKVEEFSISDAIDYFISSIQQFEAHNIVFEKALERMLSEFRRYLSIKEPIVHTPKKETIDKAQEFFDKGRKFYNEEKYAEAYIPLLQAANLGHVMAQNNIGVLFHGGYGINQDYVQAMKWYLKASEQGLTSAQINIGGLYSNGIGVKQDYAQAMQWYLKAAEQGDTNAQCYIGALYANGYGVKQDYAQAMQWYLKSSEKGNANAQFNIGKLYSQGQFVKRDYVQAMQWYLKAAQQENSDAQNNIGVLYFEGLGIKQDKKIAKEWFVKSAEQGNILANQNLEKLYIKGFWEILFS